MTDRRDDGWSLDKKIPIAIVVAFLAQCVVIVIWGTRLEATVQQQQKQFEEQRQVTLQSNLPDRMTRIEVQQTFMNHIITEMARDVKTLASKEPSK